jgi:hypothetical protein
MDFAIFVGSKVDMCLGWLLVVRRAEIEDLAP